MKMLVATVALAALITSPALAQSARQRMAEPPAYEAFGQTWQAPGQPRRAARSSNPAHDVYDSRGRYVGSDPDPAIRGQLLRDPPGVED